MAKTLSAGYSDTAISGFTAWTTAAVGINWAADYRVLPQADGSTVFRNMTSPADQPESYRILIKDVADIYANGHGASVEPQGRVTPKGGTSYLVEYRNIWVETDDTDATYRKLIPIKFALSGILPKYAGVTDSTVFTAFKRAAMGVFEQAASGETVTTNSGLAALRRGVAVKKAMIV